MRSGWNSTQLRRLARRCCVLDEGGQAALPERLDHCAVEYLTVHQCTQLRLEARERLLSGCLLVVARRIAGSPNRVSSVVGAQTPSDGLVPEARLHSDERHTPLAFDERHGTLSWAAVEPT